MDHSFIGMGSTLADEVVVEPYAMVAAGSFVQRDTKISTNEIWAGNPAQFLRTITPEEKETIAEHKQEMINLASIHSEETEQTTQEVMDRDSLRESDYYDSYENTLANAMERMGYFHHVQDRFELHDHVGQEYEWIYEQSFDKNENWKPYADDPESYPYQWRLYAEDFQRYERAKQKF